MADFSMKAAFTIWIGLMLLGAASAFAKPTPEQLQQLPPPVAHPVNFIKEIQPILEASCIQCHARGKAKGGLALDTRENLLKGGDSGPSVVIGKSEESYLIELVAGFDPDMIMPEKGSRLTPEQISLLRAWIDQDLPWDSGVHFGRTEPINIDPRLPELPPATSGKSNPIDRLLEPYFKEHKVQPGPPIDDRTFARRVYLDIIGLLPSAEELASFLADQSPDKREQLVRGLLSRNQDYAAHWLTFWNDALRNDYRGTGYIDGGRKQITSWLYSALATNMPYDRFVAELINPTPESEGFTKGIVWRGVVNASQIPAMQAAQNISQVFMGVNLKCASCHDSFINEWTLSDAYSLANIYSDKPLELFECDKPTGIQAETRFIYPQLGTIDAAEPKSERLRQLAGIMSGKQNGRLSRTIVNRLWASFMGAGLVEPVDEMETPAWHTDLLDWLAEDLVSHGYDLKHTIERITTSQAYQLPAINLGEQRGTDYVFRGPAVRRLSAEQYIDALATLTGVWPNSPAAKVDFTAGRPRAEPIPSAAPPKWIWNQPQAAQAALEETVYFRKTLSLDELPKEAFATVTCDNSFVLYVNGKKAGNGTDWQQPVRIDLRSHLVRGENVLAVEARNGLPNVQSAPNPAGLLLHAQLRNPDDNVREFISDSSWTWSNEKTAGWENTGFAASGWQPAAELGSASIGPWNLEQKFLAAGSTAPAKVRASLLNADPLSVALGRPNREQVITSRASAATTLQALELTNGPTLARQIQRGAEMILRENAVNPRLLAERIFLQGLGRAPSSQELGLALEIAGHPVHREGVEDLLWVVLMHPEFQLIH
jgi:mono/diheme cytochrome c family protein